MVELKFKVHYRNHEKKIPLESLFVRIGGEGAVNAAVDLFYTKVLADERVKDFFT